MFNLRLTCELRMSIGRILGPDTAQCQANEDKTRKICTSCPPKLNRKSIFMYKY